MKTTSLLSIFLMLLVGCSTKDVDLMSADFRACTSDRPTLVGRWIMTEFRYYGGCCPVIADSSWKKADTTPELRTVIEFTSDGRLRYEQPSKSNTASGAFAPSPSVPLTAGFAFDGREITLTEQILGGGPWYKIVKVKQLTTTQLTLAILVGKEGEMNDRRYARLCD